MGAYLSEPVVDKETESASMGSMKYGATSMQGWRINQEDAHNCILNFDENCSFFAVYDGHGGAEVSQYAARRFPEFLKSSPAWSEGRLGQALEDAFLSFDELLTHEDILEELKTLAGIKKKENEGDEPDEDKALLLQEAGLPLDDVLRRYGLRIDRNFLVSSGERTVISSKIKIKREKRAPVTTTLADSEEGPPTPPSSPDARSAAAAAAAGSTAPQSGIVEKCDSSTRQENADSLPMSPPTVEGDSSTQSKRARSNLKRKSHHASDSNKTKEHPAVSSGESGVKSNHDSPQANGNGEADNMKTGGDGAVSSVDELPNVKRFKDDGADSNKYEKMIADSTTILDDSNDATPAVTDGEQPLNGSHLEHSMAGNGTGVDSTSEDFKKKKATKTVDENAPVSGGNGGDVGSPMMVEEPSSGAKANEEKTENNRTAGDNRGCAMDESSGASEDDEDEDYNMEVEDEESSEDSSESEGIEEDEVVDENDEMGVDEEDEEEEPEDDDMFAMPSGDTPGVDSGTTACVAVIKGSTIYVANAGDSRCVLCRGDSAVDLSLDHKPEDLTEKRRIELAGGRITADGRVNGGLNLSRAIGDHFYKRNSELPLRDQMITALPDVRVEQLKAEDRFLVLACDGIWNSMSSQDVVDFVRTRLAKGLSPETICEQLCDVCLAPNTIGDGTGCDNMTAVVVLLNQNSTSSNPAALASNNEEHAADGSEAEARCT